jgi:hypothetical protein
VDYSLNQGVWKRGWNATKAIWMGWRFWVFDALVATVIGNIFAWYWGILLLLVGMFCVWLIETALAPLKQRNEARAKVIALEKEKEPSIKVQPLSCKRASYERSNNTAWAALEVKNTSSGVDLENVSVQILKLMQVFEIQDKQGIGTGRYNLHEPYPRWVPANVYWAESSAPAKQFEISISRGATKLALIASHWEYGPALGFFNTPTYPPMLESRIVIEISSPSMSTWQGAYYIEYRPPHIDEFEFIEWDLWCESHHVIESRD